jgi:RsiW-degrading membrane proteinase PrsW (M82 family)
MPHATARHHYYRLVLIVGTALLAGLSVAAASTGFAPAVWVMLALGSFFVPVVYVMYLNEIDAFGGLRPLVLVGVALGTALTALPAAIYLEPPLGAGAGALVPAMVTGLIEEAAKLGLLIVLIRFTRFRFELDGVIFGAVAGMAFAGFENVAYGLTAFSSGGVSSFLFTFWVRQILGPLGHGTWTASIAAVMWREHFAQPGRIGLPVVFAYLISSGLHGLWDWQPLPDAAAFLWWLLVGGVSVMILRRRVREALAQERAGKPLGQPS